MSYFIHPTLDGCIVSNGMTRLYWDTVEEYVTNGVSNSSGNTTSHTYTDTGSGTTDGLSQNGLRRLTTTVSLAGCPQNVTVDVKSYLAFSQSNTGGFIAVEAEADVIAAGSNILSLNDNPSASTPSGSATVEDSVTYSFSGACPKRIEVVLEVTYGRTSVDYTPITFDWELSVTITPNT